MKKYSAFCFALMGLFYAVQVSILGFTVYYLGQNGYSAFEIGTLLAVFGIISALLQRCLGVIADRRSNVDFKSILMSIGFITIILFICLFLHENNKLVVGILFGATFVCTNSMSPFVNESCFYYKNKGIDVDFGKARAIGSLSFALVSYVVGIFANIYGSRAVSFNGIVAAIIFFFVALIIPRVKSDNEKIKIEDKPRNIKDITLFSLIKKYPSFFLMVLSVIFAMCFQNSDCGYLINIIESLGGNASDLGIANAVAAIVEIPTMFMITRIMKKIKVKKLIALACIFYIVRGFVFCIPSMYAIYTGQVLQMLTFAVIVPAAVYLSDEMMYAEDKNAGQTFVGIAITIGTILGSYVGGELVTIGGIHLLEVGCIVIASISFGFALLGNIVKS